MLWSQNAGVCGKVSGKNDVASSVHEENPGRRRGAKGDSAIRKKTMSFNHFLFQTVCMIALAAAAVAGVPEGDKAVAITGDDISVSLTTDKPVYQLGEPVMLFLKLRNLTDRKLEMSRPADILLGISLIGGPYRMLKEVTDECGNTVYDEDNDVAILRVIYMTNENDGLKVPRTMYGENMGRGAGIEEIVLPPYGEYTSVMPLNALFDLNCPLGPVREKKASFKAELDYPIWQGLPDVPGFTLRLVTSFEVTATLFSSSRAFDDGLVRIFGRSKAIGLLCDEAEELIRRMRGQPETQDEDSPDRRRLMIALESLTRICESSTNMWELRYDNRTTLDDFEELVGNCRKSQVP